MSPLLLPLVLLGCKADRLALGDFDLRFGDDDGVLTVDRKGRTVLAVESLALGDGDAEITHRVGSYLFDEAETAWLTGVRLDPVTVQDGVLLVAELQAEDGTPLGMLEAYTPGPDLLALLLSPYADAAPGGGDVDRVRAVMACDGGAAFLGAGGHQLDVDHGGEAFRLWVSEPGIGKVEDDDPPDDWFVTGSRHAASYPVPFLLRPELPVGVEVETGGAVDLDLCASDPERWSVTAWDDQLVLGVVGGDSALGVVERRVQATGGVRPPPDVAYGPWNDAVRGAEEVVAAATALREAGAPTGLMWTEDWKGAEDSAFGYHLSFDWYLDEALYPDPEATTAELAGLGFQWLAYLSPFVGQDSVAWEETADAGLLVHDADGAPYAFPSALVEPVGTLDLTDPDAVAWSQERMLDLLDMGFTGWMVDFAEWLPPDAVLDRGDPVMDHNLWPLYWQQANTEVLDDVDDAVWFTRSGWSGAPSLTPVTWGGDQRTSFDADDGLPTVVALGIGTSLSGAAFFGHDIGGYSSVGNGPSDRELWFRWAWLGAFSPIMRTHHGALAGENWGPLTDEDSLQHWVRTATEHARLFPYLRGLGALAEQTGRPLILPPALVYEGDDYGRTDAWLLGHALLVAPVVEQGATGREVVLPPGDWHDWWTGDAASSGWFDADIDEIPVFAAAGTIVPLLAEVPDTFVAETRLPSGRGLTTLADVDDARLLRVFGTGGAFTEADGTTYRASGTASAAASASETLASGTIDVGGLSVEIEGAVERTYTIEVFP